MDNKRFQPPWTMQKVFSVHHQETTVNCRNFSCPQTSVTGGWKSKNRGRNVIFHSKHEDVFSPERWETITVQNSLFNYNFILDFSFKIQHLFRNTQFISYKVTYLFSDWHFSDSICDFKETECHVSRTVNLLKQHCAIISFSFLGHQRLIEFI